MDRDASTALQQPTDNWARPDGNAAVVEKPQLNGPGQRQLELACRLWHTVPEQVRQHHRIAGAGVAKGNQQIAAPRLLGCKGPRQAFRSIAIADLESLTAEE